MPHLCARARVPYLDPRAYIRSPMIQNLDMDEMGACHASIPAPRDARYARARAAGGQLTRARGDFLAAMCSETQVRDAVCCVPV